jgi:predicted transcriptional regulator
MSETQNTPSASQASATCEPVFSWKPEDGSFGILVVEVKSWSEFENEPLQLDGVARFSFANYDLLHKAMTPARIRIMRSMMGAGPLSIRGVARRMGRDFKGVHTDVSAMAETGLLLKAPDGKVVFPYDAIRFEFDLAAAPEIIAAAAE